MLHINKVKTFYGLRWAVTEIIETVDEEGKVERTIYPIEYKGSSNERDIRIALFENTNEGLKKAKELRKRLTKNKK